ncbi:unnamed protein product [Spirodela intermedia]|uniref:Phosphoribosyl-AMP cyclohydrolase domain-containing protein n=1 Tax=Spirodela intermedia TaxID=51605 RepID=A0A7I8IQX1_SPIIN|nr:unnamed protein product [Spirodela intermedia]CAA6659542.1 unnamed protein product [Spirodela intermedia]
MAAARASLSPAIPRPSSPRPTPFWRRRAFDGPVDALLDSIKWDEKGLAVAIAQNSDTGAILMQGFVNREALAKTITSRKATFYSRSRSSLWTKGETSMNFINVCEIFLDCDRDSPDGPTCHTGSETCYFSSASDILRNGEAHNHGLALTTLYSLEDTIHRRRDEIGNATDGKPSWTKRLLLDNELLCSKVREEAEELVQTLLGNEDRSRTVSEMGDLMYHAMVLLAVKGVKMEEVLEALRERFAQSGIEERAAERSPIELPLPPPPSPSAAADPRSSPWIMPAPSMGFTGRSAGSILFKKFGRTQWR